MEPHILCAANMDAEPVNGKHPFHAPSDCFLGSNRHNLTIYICWWCIRLWCNLLPALLHGHRLTLTVLHHEDANFTAKSSSLTCDEFNFFCCFEWWFELHCLLLFWCKYYYVFCHVSNTNICVSFCISFSHSNSPRMYFNIHSPINLIGFGVITSEHVEGGFRSADRKFFVPSVSPKIRFAQCFSSVSTSLTLSAPSSQYNHTGKWNIGPFRPATQRGECAHICSAHLRLCNWGIGSCSKLLHFLLKHWKWYWICFCDCGEHSWSQFA